MQRALQLAASPGVPLDPNPRVGLRAARRRTASVVGEGYHHGAGNPHAEIEALKVAGDLARGATRRRDARAVQPHRPHRAVRRGADRGRRRPGSSSPSATPTRSPRAVWRPSPRRASRSSTGCSSTTPRALNRAWTFAHEHGRPFVTWKFATTLDGRSAAADGSSRWVSSPPARRDTHVLRALCDTMLVGTNTVAVDDPQLTVRDADDQPLPGPAAPRGDGGARPRPRTAGSSTTRPRPCTCAPATRSTRSRRLYRDHDRHHVFFEGGPTLAAAFLKAGVVDEVRRLRRADAARAAASRPSATLGIRTIEQGAAARDTGRHRRPARAARRTSGSR